jgi:Kef-type K+ transport system membrane component KefB
MELIDDFKTKFPKLWSVRAQVVALLMSSLEMINLFGNLVLPFFETKLPPGLFLGLAVAANVAGIVLRGIKQVWPEVENEGGQGA